MGTFTRRHLLGSLAGFAVCSKLSYAEVNSQNPPPFQQFTITSDVERVILDVSVKDSTGGYVTGLQRQNFRIFENGRLQPITDFANVDTPVSIGLVVDDSGSMGPKRPEVVTAGLAFAKESNDKDELFVVNFNNNVVYGLPPGVAFTDDVQLLRSALYLGSPVGQTALYDAIVFALKHLQAGRQPKKTLIVVSDGGDNVSKASLGNVLNLIEASEATIYTVGLFTPDDRDGNPRVLRRIAHASGGEYFNPTMEQVVPTFHQIAKEIRNRYTIVFAPDPTLDRQKYPTRSLRVIATAAGHKHLAVRCRTSYSLKPFAQLLAGLPEKRKN